VCAFTRTLDIGRGMLALCGALGRLPMRWNNRRLMLFLSLATGASVPCGTSIPNDPIYRYSTAEPQTFSPAGCGARSERLARLDCTGHWRLKLGRKRRSSTLLRVSFFIWPPLGPGTSPQTLGLLDPSWVRKRPRFCAESQVPPPIRKGILSWAINPHIKTAEWMPVMS
jgi:hypothetical protein